MFHFCYLVVIEIVWNTDWVFFSADETRVATAQEIWLSLFPHRENTGNLGTTQGKLGQQISLKMKYFVVNCPDFF